MNLFPRKGVDLSGGLPPEKFYVCLIDDPTGLEAWRADESICMDYKRPSSNWCAMTTLRSMQLIRDGEAPSLDELFEAACSPDVGVYKWRENVLGHGPGWHGGYHEELALFYQNYGFDSFHRREVTTDHFVEALEDGWFVIPSVSPEIRFPRRRREPLRRGGHVVLVYGYATEKSGKRVFRIQNSAGFQSERSQVGVRITERRMRQVLGAHATFARFR